MLGVLDARFGNELLINDSKPLGKAHPPLIDDLLEWNIGILEGWNIG
jgi:hypothetical protein